MATGYVKPRTQVLSTHSYFSGTRAFAMRSQWDEQTDAWPSQSVPRWP